MNLPSFSKKIGAHDFEVTVLPMGKWLALETLVVKIIGPSFAELIAKKDEGQFAGIGFALCEFARNANQQDQEHILALLSSATKVNGSPMGDNAWQVFWPCNLRILAEYISFAMTAQFSDFFVGVGNVIGPQIFKQ